MAVTLLLGLLALSVPVHAQTQPPVQTPAPTNPGDQYFYENGHNVEEPFASFYLKNGGLARFGYPITDKFTHPTSGVVMQYFQKGRLDYTPNDPLAPVKVAPLGDDMGKRQPPMPVGKFINDPSCQYFPESGHQACYAFAEYHRNHNRTYQLGAPIGPFVLEGGRMVQYFQNARLDFLPEQPTRNRVQLADLGIIHFDQARLDRNLLAPTNPVFGLGTPINGLRARAHVAQAFMAPGNQQRITVRVTDQLGRPVPEALVTLQLKLGANNTPSYSMPLTDKNGYTSLFVPAGSNVRSGTVVYVQAEAVRANLRTTTNASYIIWSLPNRP